MKNKQLTFVLLVALITSSTLMSPLAGMASETSSSITTNTDTSASLEKEEEVSDKPTLDTIKNTSTEDLLAEIGESVQQLSLKHQLYPSVFLGHILLASNFGANQLAQAPYFNLFEVEAKEKEDKIALSKTTTKKDGHLFNEVINYRVYKNYKQGLESYLKEGENADSRLSALNHKKQTQGEAIVALSKLNEASPIYAKRLSEVIETYELSDYDEVIKEQAQAEKKAREKKAAEKKAAEKEAKEKIAAINEANTDFVLPLTNYQVTSEFGNRSHPINGEQGNHGGIDLAAPTGTSVMASRAGKVIESGFNNSAGNYVIVHHDNGVYTNYFHLDSLTTKEGAYLSKGEEVGKVGTTGDSTGPHLHFAFSTGIWNGFVNPRDYLAF